MDWANGAWATCWEVKSVRPTITQARISISSKDKDTGEYETVFSHFISFLGADVAKKALSLKPKDRIRLERVGYSEVYDSAEKKVKYQNWKCYEFSTQDEANGNNSVSNRSEVMEDPSFVMNEGATEDDLPW